MMYVSKSKYLYLFILLLYCCLGRSAEVDANQVFKIENIEVDETADTAIAARDQALENSQREAWKLLVSRITLPNDKQKILAISIDEIKSLVQGYEVVREKVSPVRYLANITVAFNPELVRGIFLDNGVPFAETPSLPILLIPIYETNGVSQLWDGPNPWRDVWKDSAFDNSLLPIIVPSGDFEDIKYLSASQAINGNLSQFETIMEKYDATKVIVAKVSRKFDLIDNSPLLEITIRLHEAGNYGETIVDVIKVSPDSDLNELMISGKQKIMKSLRSAWKKENMVTSGVKQRVSAEVPIMGLTHWLSIRSKLREIGTLRIFDLVRLTREKALVDLWIMGSLKQLRNALQHKRLALYENDEFLILCEQSDITPQICNEMKNNIK